MPERGPAAGHGVDDLLIHTTRACCLGFVGAAFLPWVGVSKVPSRSMMASVPSVSRAGVDDDGLESAIFGYLWPWIRR
jgi:hypothetical protein